MMPRTAIAQIAKMIGQELDTGVGPSEEALAAGPILAEAGATTEIVGGLLAETHRKRPDDRMIAGYTFILEGALGTLRLQSSGGDIEAGRAIAEVRHKLDDAVRKGGIAPEVLMLMARAFARAELDPGRTLQQAMMTAMEAQSPSVSSALTPAEISDPFAELAAALDNDPSKFTRNWRPRLRLFRPITMPPWRARSRFPTAKQYERRRSASPSPPTQR